MHRRKWDAQIKARIVLEGVQGEPFADICAEHQISQSPSSQWRDQCLAHAANACEAHQHTRTEARLAQENVRRKTLGGELTPELQKSDELWG